MKITHCTFAFQKLHLKRKVSEKYTLNTDVQGGFIMLSWVVFEDLFITT